MEKTKTSPRVITSHAQLMYKIMHLNARKEEQEETLKRNVKEIFYSFHPSVVVNTALKQISKDTQLQSNLGKLGLRFGAGLLSGKIFKKQSPVKGILSSILMERAASFIWNKNSVAITSGVGKLANFFRKKTTPE